MLNGRGGARVFGCSMEGAGLMVGFGCSMEGAGLRVGFGGSCGVEKIPLSSEHLMCCRCCGNVSKEGGT